MKNIKDLFVTYEIALKLKELGFDENCFGYYDLFNNKLVYTFNVDNSKIELKAALWQQAVDWFESKGYYINATRAFRWNPRPIEFSGWCVYIGAENPEEEFECNSYFLYHHYSTKIEAQEQAILKCIELYKMV